jgi:4'-phosphopantetheinyl transferase EntD
VIEELLPKEAVAVEMRGDTLNAVLYPQEADVVAKAVERRRREFATGRACAREALGKLGFPPGPIGVGVKGEPLWPAGAVGSITHCDGYRACAVPHAGEIVTIGIDCEPHAALPERLLADVAGRQEQEALRLLRSQAPGVHWDTLLFCAKEALYKAWFPLAGRWLGFEDALVSIDRHRGSFTGRLLVPGPMLDDGPLRALAGRWLLRDNLLITAIVLPRTAHPAGGASGVAGSC